jgi:adenine-specific DNA-methyltransferase
VSYTMDSRVIQLTNAAHKYGNLNIRSCGKAFFPKDVYGASCRKAGLGKQITLHVEGLPQPIETDIPSDRITGRPRWIFRERKWVKEFLRHHKLAAGDAVTIQRVSNNRYWIRPPKRKEKVDLFEDELTPVLYAQRLAEQYVASTSTQYRKQRGQYFTPPEVATFIGELAAKHNKSPIRILDPGAGLGILSCAVCQKLAQKCHMKRIELDAYENDVDLAQSLYKTFDRLQCWLRERGVHLEFNIIDKDFVLSAAELIGTQDFRPYDLVVSNPPYRKISGSDPRSHRISEVVHGQPNVYMLFMATATKLLKRFGLMVFITPRSYTAGHYFRAFRQVFFEEMKPVRVHLFESRRDVFSDQSVLQENAILMAQKAKTPRNVTISNSINSASLHSGVRNQVPLSCAFWRSKNDTILRLPIDDFDNTVIKIVDSWTATLSDYGLQISTGPVVPFRAKDLLSISSSLTGKDYIPLIWMRNVQPMQTIWPCDGARNREARHQFIVDNAETRRRRLLVRNKNMVFLRRFSAKEQKRRLTASPLFREQLCFEFIGVENHVNYIHSPECELTRDQVFGLAAILNSALLDRYFRICNGNTQVSATELRSMPLPPLGAITRLGRQLMESPSVPTLQQIDRYVWEMVKPNTKRKGLLKRVSD